MDYRSNKEPLATLELNNEALIKCGRFKVLFLEKIKAVSFTETFCRLILLMFRMRIPEFQMSYIRLMMLWKRGFWLGTWTFQIGMLRSGRRFLIMKSRGEMLRLGTECFQRVFSFLFTVRRRNLFL